MQDLERAILAIAILNDLAGKSANGIVPFGSYYGENRGTTEEPVVYDESNGKVVCDMCLIDHHDIVGYYDELPLRVIDEGGVRFVSCYFPSGVGLVIKNGRWYVGSM